jgi:hypothetical protein
MHKTGFVFNNFIPLLIDPLFCALFKTDALYANEETTKYSITRITEDYFRYSEGIK